jgi:hypothetical protein
MAIVMAHTAISEERERCAEAAMDLLVRGLFDHDEAHKVWRFHYPIPAISEECLRALVAGIASAVVYSDAERDWS